MPGADAGVRPITHEPLTWPVVSSKATLPLGRVRTFHPLIRGKFLG